jgi:hypothetical protein
VTPRRGSGAVAIVAFKKEAPHEEPFKRISISQVAITDFSMRKGERDMSAPDIKWSEAVCLDLT